MNTLSNACALGLVAALAPVALAPDAFASVSVRQDNGQHKVTFSLQPQGGAHRVEVAGSFNGWQPNGAWALSDPDQDGRFEGEFVIPAGRHTYKFVVDGNRWLQDPENSEGEDDGHQGQNSVVTVGGAHGGGGGAGSPFGTVHSRTRQKCFVGAIYFVDPGTTALPDFSQMTPQGKIYSETFNVAPRPFDNGFPGLTDRFEWFAIRYRGEFEAPKTGVYRFRLLSDDGSRLFINGKLALDNDGLHEPREVAQKVRLKKGKHELTLDYMQGPAMDVALQLWVTFPTSTEEKLVQACSVPKASKRVDR